MPLLMKIALALGLVLSPPVEAAAAGPQCTWVYPRGFTVEKVTKKKRKRAVRVCEGDLQATWRTCEQRYNT